jgi:hypothetical protein
VKIAGSRQREQDVRGEVGFIGLPSSTLIIIDGQSQFRIINGFINLFFRVVIVLVKAVFSPHNPFNSYTTALAMPLSFMNLF